MEVFWFWFLAFLLIILVFSWPTWPYTHDRWVYRRGAVGDMRRAAALQLLRWQSSCSSGSAYSRSGGRGTPRRHIEFIRNASAA